MSAVRHRERHGRGAARRLSLCLVMLLLALPLPRAMAEGFGFMAPSGPEDPQLPVAMRDLAERMLLVYEDPDIQRYLDNLSALQLAVGDERAAFDTRRALRDRRRGAGQPPGRAVIYDLYAQARTIAAQDGLAFPQAYRRAFTEVIPRLSARELHSVANWLRTPPDASRERLQAALDRLRAKDTISSDEAMDLIWAYVAFDAYRSFGPMVEGLLAEEDQLRYRIEDDVLIRTPAGASIHAFIVRPSRASAPLPTLLEFTIDPTTRGEAKAAAARDYVGVVAYTRGSRGGGRVVPFDHEGEDARAVIAWIAQQPWSDGRVGMIGDGYSGFAAWAAAVRSPAALKAIASISPMAPGVDFPMAGNIFRNEAYRWAEEHAGLGGSSDDTRWRDLDRAWYRSGRRYRDLETLPGAPGRAVRDLVRSWLTHPSYDRFWSKRIPQGQQLAALDIPVLTATGYYARGQAGALYYFTQQLAARPDADHTLLVGDYDDRGQPVTMRAAGDDQSTAPVDLRQVRFDWLDHVFKGAPRPEVLAARVNYQLGDEWRHAASLDAMGATRMRLYLNAPADGAALRLSAEPRRDDGYIEQIVDLADRSDADAPQLEPRQTRELPARNALVFASEPLPRPTVLSGRFSGEFDLVLNRMDVDLRISLYEQTSDGHYQLLCEPWAFRASYLANRSERHLLKAGIRQRLPFTSERLLARELARGSRLVMVLGVNKRPDQEINYGSGKDVSEESIADAVPPLRLRWYGGSYVDLPSAAP